MRHSWSPLIRTGKSATRCCRRDSWVERRRWMLVPMLKPTSRFHRRRLRRSMLVSVGFRPLKKLLTDSISSGNASTWAWLTLKPYFEIRRGGNAALAEAVLAIYPEFPSIEHSIKNDLRSALSATRGRWIPEDKFYWHGRLITSRCL